jgi:pimeloyl-ACP methyl ester carboxylesterase
VKPSRLLLGALVGAQVALAGCGGGNEPGRLVTETVGTGPQTATIVRPAGDERRPVVLFLHGWGATRPRFYRPWIDHLAREGNAVIYPRYQDSVVDPPAEVLGNVLAGVRQAFARIEGEYRLRTACNRRLVLGNPASSGRCPSRLSVLFSLEAETAAPQSQPEIRFSRKDGMN